MYQALREDTVKTLLLKAIAMHRMLDVSLSNSVLDQAWADAVPLVCRAQSLQGLLRAQRTPLPSQ